MDRSDQIATRYAPCAAALRCLLLVWFLFLTTGEGARAASSDRWTALTDPVFKPMAGEPALASSGIVAIEQDRDGFLWVGNQNGLIRWDGYRSRTYLFNEKDPNSLPENYVGTLGMDRSGRLWIGTTNGSLAYYDRQRDNFVRVPLRLGGAGRASISSIKADRDGGVWVGTNKGLAHIDAAAAAVVHLPVRRGAAGAPAADSITELLVDRDNVLWVAADNRLMRREPAGSFVEVPLDVAGSQPVLVKVMLQTADGRIWLGTAGHGALVLNPKNGTVVPVHDPRVSGPPPQQGVWHLLEAPDGKVWMAVSGQGINIVDAKTLHVRQVRQIPGMQTSLGSNWVKAMLVDSSGLIWVGTTRGLSRHNPQDGILTVWDPTVRIGGSTTGQIFRLLPGADGKIWFGVNGHGLVQVDPENPASAPAESSVVKSGVGASTAAIEGLSVQAVTATPDGGFYIGTNRGLVRAAFSGRALSYELVPAPSPRTPVRAFVQDQNSLWIGTYAGLWLLDLGAGSSALPRLVLEAAHLTDSRITALALSPDHQVWIGTFNGLNLYNPVTGKVEQLRADSAAAGTIPKGPVWSLLTDRRQRLWVGTPNGINLLQGRDGNGKLRFQHMGVEEGLSDIGVATLLEDAGGNIWASADDGLLHVDGKTLAVRHLRASDGADVPEYITGSGAVASTGELLFGGATGMSVVFPERVKEWGFRPPLVVTDIRVGGKPIPASRFNAPAGAESEPLVVAPDANSLSVEFAALDFSEPEKNRYAYRLEGYDEGWIDTDATRRLASYTNLSPGDYRLHLRGSNRNGAWTERELVVPIRILPAWHQTWWAHLAEALAVASALYAVVYVRTRYLRRRQHELEDQVNQRTSELAQANAMLEQNQSELTRFLAVASHDLRQPMHALNLYLGALSSHDMPPAARPVLSNVRQCAQIMDDMFLALLDLSRLDAQVVAPDIASFPIGALLSSIEVEFAPQARAKGLRLRVARCSAWVCSDAGLVEQILRNLTANAVRYTESGSILVGCRRRDNWLRLAVFDTGIGITADQQKSVFEEFCQLGNPGRDRTKGLGLGLAIVRRLARLLGTPITLISEPGRGSMFAVDLPLVVPSAIDNAGSVPSRRHTTGMEAASQAFAGRTIVVVDDEESILDAMHLLLGQWGCSVVTAMSAQDALSKLSHLAKAPDAIICDYRLQLHETGVDVITALQSEFNCEIPAMIITGTVTPERIIDIAASGMTVLHKPVDAMQLYEALAGLLGVVQR